MASLQEQAAQDMTVPVLKLLIISWAVLVIVLALTIDNGWILAGILAWEVLP